MKIKTLGGLFLLLCFLGNLFVLPAVLLRLLDRESDLKTSSIQNIEDGPEILEIKIAMALPYASEWDSPKESNGLLERNGEFYTLMESNFVNDSLYFKYVKNNNAREIFSMLSNQVGQSDPSDKSNSSTGSLFFNWMSLKYKVNSENAFQHPDIKFLVISRNNFYYSENFYSLDSSIDTPPPQLI